MKLRNWFFTLIASTTCLFATSYAEVPRTVHIAGNIPLTGELAAYGAAVKNGATLAAEEASPNNGELPLAFNWQDNLGNNATTNTVLRAQLVGAPDIYISGFKPQTMVITDELSRRNMPHFTWIVDVKINPNSKNNLRTWINFKAESEAFISYLRSKPAPRVAMFYADLPAAELEYKQIVAPWLKQNGTTDVLIENYPLDTTDFRSSALRIKQFKPDIIIVNGFVNHLIPFVRALRSYDLIRNGNCLVSFDMLEGAFQMQPKEIEGVVVATPSFLTAASANRYEVWKKKYEDRFGDAPMYHAAYAYDMVKLIREATKTLPAQWDSTKLLTTLRTTKVDGITGPISLDQDGSLEAQMIPQIYKDGRLTSVENKATK